MKMRGFHLGGPLGSRTKSGFSFGSGALLDAGYSPDSSHHSWKVGFLPERDEGTEGDWFVDNVNGHDDNAGNSVASAFATPEAAIRAASPGDTIRIRNISGKPYRVTIDPAGLSGSPAKRSVIAGYGFEKPVISGADLLTGAIQCTAADEIVVGGRYASIFKVENLPLNRIASGDPRAAFLFENGRRLIPAMLRLPNPQYPGSEYFVEDWLTASETITIGGDVKKVAGHRLPDLTNQFSKEQIENCDVVYHRAPNGSSRSKVAYFDPVMKAFILEDQSARYESNVKRDRFALVNLLPTMRRGQWGYADNGDGTCNIYFWPWDVSNVNVNVEYSARGRGVVLDGLDHFELRGLIVERTASSGSSANPNYAIAAVNDKLPRKKDIVLNNCCVRQTYRSGLDYAPVWLKNVDNPVVQNCMIEDAIGQFGVFFHSGHWKKIGMATGAIFDLNVVQRTDNSPVRSYGQQLSRFSRNFFLQCGNTAHANKGNTYVGGDKNLWAHNLWAGCDGYLTWQVASGQFIYMNYIPTIFWDDGRGVHDQNKSNDLSPATTNGTNGDSYFINNMVAPYKLGVRYNNSVNLGKDFETNVPFSVMNNIMHGATGTAKANMLLPGGVGSNVMTNGAKIVGSDRIVDYWDVYENVQTGNLSVKVSSPTRTANSSDISLMPGTDGPISFDLHWPDYDFAADLSGEPIDLRNPPVGPLIDPDKMPEFGPFWIDRPEITGKPIAGQALSVVGGYVHTYPFGSITYQWLRTKDPYAPPSDWEPIEGATGESHSYRGEDVGYYPALRSDLNGTACETVLATPIRAVGSIGEPILLTRYATSQSVSAGEWLETAAFKSNGNPILLVISNLNRTGKSNAASATLGSIGRNRGSGKKIRFEDDSLHSGEIQSHVALLDATPDGIVSIQYKSLTGSISTHLAVFEIEGVGGVSIGPEKGGVGVNSAKLNATTNSINQLVLYVLTRLDGDLKKNPIIWDGGERLLTANTNGSDKARDLSISIAFERASEPGHYERTVSYPIGRSMTSAAVTLSGKD